MSLQKRFYPSACAFFALILSMSSSLLHGQAVVVSTQSATPISAPARTVTANFVTAPTLALSNAPSGVVSTDLDGDGKPDLVVASASSGKVTVYPGKGKGKFGSPVDYSVSGHPSAIVAADIDGDGVKDIVTANGVEGTVSVLLTTAGGKLGPPRVYSVGADLSLLAAGDLNGDGKQDVVVASKSAKFVAVLLNDGQGVLQSATLQSLSNTPNAFALGDLNGDKHLDLAIAFDNGTVGTLLGTADGSLKPSGSFSASAARLSAIAAADLNGDGKLDLIVTDPGGRLLTIFQGNGDGTFSKGASYSTGNNASSIVASDVNGDGLTDLIAVNSGSNTLSVLLGNGDGSFRSATSVTVGNGPVALAVADFYGDGYQGVAVVNTSANSLSVIAGKGDGTFRAAPSYSGDLSPRAIASGDLNGDGLPDIVVTNFCGSDMNCSKPGSLSVYLAQKAGGYQLASTQSIGSGPVSVALADLNGDGKLDVVALNRTDKSFSVLLGVGDGTFQAALTSPLVGSPVEVAAKDLDKDGKLDLAVVSDCGSSKCTQRGSVETYFGLGDGTFRFGSSTPVGYSPASIAAGDLNGDGVPDLVVANACGKDASCNSAGTASILLGASAGTFVPQPEIILNNGPSSVALRAVSGSSALDLVVSHGTDNTIAVLPGNGDGTFKAASLYTVGTSPRSLVVADLNGDGRPDVAVANAKDATVSVLYGRADGTLVGGESYAVAAGPEALTAIASASGAAASLVTANGNSASTPPGSEITSLTNLGPNATTPTATTLTITSTFGTVNSAFTLTANLVPAPPDGEFITFSSDVSQFTDCPNPAPIASGTASCMTSQLTAGQRTLTASYAGDADYDPSSDSEPQTVNPVAATLGLAGPATAPTVNQPATFTATLGAGSGSFSPTAPSGAVSFTVTGQTGASCPSVTLAGGTTTATCTFTPVSAGSVSVVANYSSDPNFTVSGSSNNANQTVSPVAATLSLAQPATAPMVNQSVTYVATLGAGTGSLTPTAPAGTVSFTISGQAGASCANVTLSGGVTASCTFTAVSAGPVSIVANYANDPNFTVSSPSNTVNQTISPVPATLSVPAPAATPTVNQSITYTATLGAGTGSFTPTAPSGTISFTISGQQSLACPATTVSATTLTASCTFTPTSAGTVSVVANYAGDANFTVANGGTPGTQTVQAAAATLTVAAPSTTPTVNQSTTFTATLGPGSGSFSPTAPSGTISFAVTGQQGLTCPSVPVSASALTATCIFTPTSAGSVTVTASYGSDNNFTVAGGSAPVSQPVNKVADTLQLGTSSQTSSINQSVTFTAMVGPNGALSPTAPTGTVAFSANQTPITSCQAQMLTGITATCTISSLNTFANTITASYSGDGNYLASSAPSITQSVISIAATTAVGVSSQSVVVNQPVTFTATLQGTVPGPVIPTGSVNFTQGGNTLCSMVTLTNASATTATATCQTAFAAASSTGYTVVATYVPNGTNFTAGTPGSAPAVVVGAAATSVGLNSSGTPSSVDQSVTFTATVSPSPQYTPQFPGASSPTGSVTFVDQTRTPAVTLCANAPLASTGPTATCSVALLYQGSHSIVATFNSADSNFTTSTSTVFPQAVNATTTVVHLSSSKPSPAVKESLVLTATVTPGVTGTTTPQGMVTFTDGLTSTALCTVQITSSQAGTFTCNVSFSTAGVHPITATYTSSDTNFTGNSDTLQQVVAAATTTLQINTSNAAPTVDQNVNLTAVLTPEFAGPPYPAGRVTFTDSLTRNTICSVTVNADGSVPACPAYAFPTFGSRTVSASFTPSDSNFAPASSNNVTVNVSSATTTLQISLSNVSPIVNQQVLISATLGAQYTGSAAPQGKVTFTDSLTQTAICVVLLDANGNIPSCPSFSFPSPGSRTVTGVFAPSDSNFVTATSAPVGVTVSAATTSLQITTSTASPVVDQLVAFNATLAPQFAGSAIPQGTVTFTDSTTKASVCTVSLDATGNVPSCPLYAFQMPGSRTITAVFAPAPSSSSFAASTSSPVAETVSQSGTTVRVQSISAASGATGSLAVNEQLLFSALVTPANSDTGLVVPGGTVVFSTNGVTICTATSISTTGVATCTAPLGAAGTYAVTATYSGDANFLSSPVSAPSTLSLVQGQTSISLSSSSPTSVATRSVTYTATLNVTAPAAISTASGTVPLAGTISFASGGNVTVPANCTSAVSNTAGSAYLCTITYPAGTSAPFAVTATFNPTGANFASSSNTVMQTVQDFSLRFVSGAAGSTQTYAGPLTVTQSYTSMKDPFNAVPTLATSLTPISGFGDNPTYTCSLPAAAAGLSCSVTPASGLGSQTVVFTALSTATLGTYTATLTATDPLTTALSRSTSITVNVAGSVPTSLSPGVTGTVSVPFTVPSPQDTYTFACSQILLASTLQPTSLIKCTPVTASGTLSSGSASFIIAPTTQTSMSVPPSGSSNRLFAAAFFCAPLLAFAGCLGRRRSASQNFFRFLAAITVLAGVLQATGCGGGFNLPAQTATSTTGNYLVQVTATDTTQASRPVYDAIIPVAVQ